MKTFLPALLVFFLSSSMSSACTGCKVKGSGTIASNIQSTLGSPSASLSGSRIIAGQGTKKVFANDKVFESVGKDQSEADPNWKSSITE